MEVKKVTASDISSMNRRNRVVMLTCLVVLFVVAIMKHLLPEYRFILQVCFIVVSGVGILSLLRFIWLAVLTLNLEIPFD